MVLSGSILRTMRRHKQIKAALVGLKISDELLKVIDQAAESEGLTRSAIIRRILLERYRDRLHTTHKQEVA